MNIFSLHKIKENPELFKKSQRDRGKDDKIIDDIVNIHNNILMIEQESNGYLNNKNIINKDIGRGKIQLSDVKDKLNILNKKIKDNKVQLDNKRATLNELLFSVHNLVYNAPVGDVEKYEVIEYVNTDHINNDIKVIDYLTLGEKLNILDVKRAAKVSGSGYYYSIGDGALLEMALINYAIEFGKRHEFNLMIPPVLVNESSMHGTGYISQVDGDNDIYRIYQDKDMYLVGTSEVSLIGFHRDEILDLKELPLQYMGLSTCFRRESGSYGKMVRGISRVHQFNKVEMVLFVDNKLSFEYHMKLLNIEKEFLASLELPFRIIDIPTEDLGMSATRKFDCEVFIPSLGIYREVASISDCTTFQSYRLNIRTRDKDNKKQYPATLNGTLCAVPRLIIAILENCQTKDGNIRIPKVLRKYFGKDMIM